MRPRSERVGLSVDDCYSRSQQLLAQLYQEERLADRSIVSVLLMALCQVLAFHEAEKDGIAIDFIRATAPKLRADLAGGRSVPS